jgi:hypothetical protein
MPDMLTHPQLVRNASHEIISEVQGWASGVGNPRHRAVGIHQVYANKLRVLNENL